MFEDPQGGATSWYSSQWIPCRSPEQGRLAFERALEAMGEAGLILAWSPAGAEGPEQEDDRGGREGWQGPHLEHKVEEAQRCGLGTRPPVSTERNH